MLYLDKWIKYSLEDDGIERIFGMLGDVLNRYVVFFFVDEMCKRKDNLSDFLELDLDIVMLEKYIFLKFVIKYKLLGD